jgi:hypothetical protein
VLWQTIHCAEFITLRSVLWSFLTDSKTCAFRRYGVGITGNEEQTRHITVLLAE